jgi:Na+/melibiose symporter-like transporter
MTDPAANAKPDQTITEKSLNATRFGGVTAAVMGVVTALVPVVTSLADRNVHVSIIVGMEALAAVLALVAAWIYTIDVQTRTELAKSRIAAPPTAVGGDGASAAISSGMPFTVQVKSHPTQRENVLAVRYDPASKDTFLLVAEEDGSPSWQPLKDVERAERSPDLIGLVSRNGR